MSGILKRISKYLGVGRARYYVGSDLHQNTYYEYPSLHGDDDPRKTRRMIRYREHKQMGEFDQSTLPVQWSMWLRHTRRSAPTVEELLQDQERIRSTQHNAFVLEQRDAQRRLELQQKAEKETLQRQQIEQESYSSPGAGAGARATAVPTATVSDAGVTADARQRIPFDDPNNDTSDATRQERTVDMEVWEASRKRVQEQQLHAQQSEAQSARAAKRASLDAQDAERERAKRVMSASPLSAFDVSYDDDGAPPPQQQQQQQQQSASPLKPRFGRAAGPGEEWVPEDWKPRPVQRR